MTPPLYFQSAKFTLLKTRWRGHTGGCFAIAYGKCMLVILHTRGLAVSCVRSAVASFSALKVPPFFDTFVEPETRL